MVLVLKLFQKLYQINSYELRNGLVVKLFTPDYLNISDGPIFVNIFFRSTNFFIDLPIFQILNCTSSV